jgi:ketosteroid isomerase-like protein
MTSAHDGDIEGVIAASRAFYLALAVLDDGTRMQAVWANAPYVTYVGPHSASIIVGWDAQKRYWKALNSAFTGRSVCLADAHIRVVGHLAWQIGAEVGEARMKDGTVVAIDWIVTNVFERIAGHWLLVSHHAQPKPLECFEPGR